MNNPKEKPHKHKYVVSTTGYEQQYPQGGGSTYLAPPLHYAVAVCEECGAMIKSYL